MSKEFGAGLGIGAGLAGGFFSFREHMLPGQIIFPLVVLASLAVLFTGRKKQGGVDHERAIDQLL